MKKLVFIFCALALTILSCETNESQDNTQDIDQAKIENLKSMTPDAQKIAFNVLNYAERAKLWNDRIDLILDTQDLNSIQKESIIKLKRIVKPDLFNVESDILNENLKGWVMDNEDNFSKEVFFLYFITVDDLDSLLSRDYLTHVGNDGGGGSGQERDDCDCNRLEDYCWGSDYECKKTNCITSMTGCGFLWNNTCNGECGLKN